MPLRIAVADYGMGNLRSVLNALEALEALPVPTARAADLAAADGVVVPGVGAFGDAMGQLAATGLDRAVRDAAAGGRPVLGICLGMQVLFEGSEEAEGVPGLGLLPGTVRRLPPGRKVPHIGWNTVEWAGAPTLFRGLTSPAYFYFVHSYYCPLPAAGAGYEAARCEYGVPFAAAVWHGNLMGTQFHPEKSGRAGLALLRNFLALCGAAAGGRVGVGG